MESRKKQGVNTNRSVLIIVLLVIAVVAYYCYLVTRADAKTAEPELTRADEVLLRNMSNNYPPTPKEVIKYYNEIMKCFYNEDCSQEEIEDLARRARELYDDDLVRYNSWDNYIIALSAEIASYHENGRKLTGCSVAASTDVDYFEEDGYSFARISCRYTISQGKEAKETTQIYLLRKDDDGHWRIFGWDLAENVHVGK